MIWLLIGTVLLLLSIIGAKVFVTAEPKTLSKVVSVIISIVSGLFGLFMMVRGNIAFGLFALAIAAYMAGFRTPLSDYIDQAKEQARQQQRHYGPRSRSHASMTTKEAAEILGVPITASRDEILAAHRELMKKIHPDHGGNDYLATKVNQAKDVLLNE